MNTIVCEEVGRFKWTQMTKPSPTSGEAIVRVKRIGICGTDLHAYRGNQPFFTYPRILGHELSGVIEWIDEQNSGYKVGDQVSVIPYLHCDRCIACRIGKTNCCTALRVLGVHADGGMREFISVPITHLINTNDISIDQAAVIEPLSIGAHAVKRAELIEGETVLVIGAGPIGLGVMALAKLQGAKVIAMDINEERLAYCKTWAGVDETVLSLEDPTSSIATLTNDEYPTVVFDATGNARAMSNAVHYLAHGGRLVFVGLVKGEVAFDDAEFHKREATLLRSRNATRADFEYVLDHMREGRLNVDSYITHRVSFDRLIDRFEEWLQPTSHVIKAMVELE